MKNHAVARLDDIEPEPEPIDLDALAPVVQLRKGQPAEPVHVITTLPEPEPAPVVAPPAPPRVRPMPAFKPESLIPVLFAFAALGIWAWVTLWVISW